MPLLKGSSKYKNTLGDMDIKIFIRNGGTPTASTGGDAQYTEHDFGPVWAKREYLSRKQMETEVANRITSIQQIRFTVRDETTINQHARKSGTLWVQGEESIQYNIISISKDLGRGQFLQIVTEQRE